MQRAIALIVMAAALIYIARSASDYLEYRDAAQQQREQNSRDAIAQAMKEIERGY